MINVPYLCMIYTVSSSSFSIGYIFYYWRFYKHQGVNKEKQSYRNKNDHSGYEPYELFIEPKYKNIKHEVLNNTIYRIDMEDLNESIIKSEQYLNIDTVRNTKSTAFIKLAH